MKRPDSGRCGPARVVAALTLALALGTVEAEAQAVQTASDSALSVVRGILTDHWTGMRVAGAVVLLGAGPHGLASAGTRDTGVDGTFRFDAVEPGTYALTVTLLGYSPLQDTLYVEPAAIVDLVLELSPTPIALPPVVVTTRRHLSRTRDGFAQRQARGLNNTAFFTRSDYEKRPIRNVTDVLEMSPGVSVQRIGPLGNFVTVEDGCRPAVWIDGFRYLEFELPVNSGGDPIGVDVMLGPDEVDMVEMYTRRHDVPPQFGPACGAMVIWTRPDNRARMASWQRLLIGIAMFGTAVWLVR